MKRAFAATLLVLIALPLFSAEDAERRRLVAELVKLVDPASFHRLVEARMLQRGAPSSADAGAYFDKVLGRVDFAKIVQEVDVPLVEKTFTDAELREVIAFLKTKSGQKLMQVMPEMTAEGFVQTTAAFGQAARQAEEETRKQSPEKKAWADIRTIATACESYATDENHYPKAATMNELRKLLEPTYVRMLPLQDPWGHDYVYRVSADGEHYRIVSAGADGRFERSSEIIVDVPEHVPIRAAKSLDEDIIYQDGRLLQAPESIAKDIRQP